MSTNIIDNICFDSDQAQPFHFCIKIIKHDNEILYLTSSHSKHIIGNDIYINRSSLEITNCHHNDSAEDIILIKGIFEKGGIEKFSEIENARFEILICYEDKFENYALMYCTEFKQYDLSFEIKLEPETRKYNTRLLNSYSQTCRANFGDSKCKLDIYKYSLQGHIFKMVNHNSFIFKDISIDDYENGYFDNGMCIINANVDDSSNVEYKYRIYKQEENKITLYLPINKKCKVNYAVRLIPSCDKTYEACKKYNNILNFRGEPFIPQYNFIRS